MVSSGHGAMIVARNDFRMIDANLGYGVGYQLFTKSVFDPEEVQLVLQMLGLRRGYFGDGVVALDCGANIGVHTVEWSRHMFGWGKVIAVEAQERIYYALAGNVALNNCMNASVIHCAVGDEMGIIDIPNLDYASPSSFGSFELKKRANTEFIGQKVDYEKGATTPVKLITIDSLNLQRLDFLKMDVEGMEIEALNGALETIKTHKPQLLIEFIKAEPGAIEALVQDLGYTTFVIGGNVLAVHKDDPGLSHITPNVE
jgi:FkbM family methyltransferase